MKKKCLIVGLDGFDVDVLVNLMAFYAAAGFEVAVSRMPANTDLLVIHRGGYNGTVFEVRASECHIYDYSVLGTSELFRACVNIPNTVVIAPSGMASGPSAPPSLVRSFHPVIPSLWSIDAEIPRTIPMGHIGHRKPHMDEDPWQVILTEAVRSRRVEVWGDNWRQTGDLAKHKNVHPPSSIHATQTLYARMRCAVGIMYPFQRETSISGRMWQAPLRGCPLISEPVVLARDLPGVHVSDRLEADMPTICDIQSGLSLAGAAKVYWGGVTQQLAAALGLPKIDMNNTASSVYFREIISRHILHQLLRARRAVRKAFA